MRDFIIVGSKFTTNSNGIKTLHKICHTINKLGGTARMAFIASNDPTCQDIIVHDDSWVSPDFNTPPLQNSERHLIQSSYVLYPEVIIGNPLAAPHVIRYFGNREGFCNGMVIGVQPTDFLLAHSHATRKDAHCILFNSEINPVFHDNDTLPTMQRRLDASYVGKGYLYGPANISANTLYIARDWPQGQEQLALLLRQIRVFYTLDSWTSTNLEAILCGAVPFFLRYEPWTEEDIDGSELGRIPRLDLNHRDFDPVRFMEERNALKARIDELARTWDARVFGFMQQVAKHFEERVAA